ncbi:MAG: hypothetical protein ABIJ59_04850 [Pseudomonadota bacterium]
MRILYGIQGTGNGHVSRATRIIDCLPRRKITVDVIFSGCDTDKVYDQSIVPPVIPDGVTSSDTMDPALVLVYLPFANRDQVRQMLQPFRHMRFAVYAQNQKDPIKEDHHILDKKPGFRVTP